MKDQADKRVKLILPEIKGTIMIQNHRPIQAGRKVSTLRRKNNQSGAKNEVDF
ncbi:MAG: hypothetical protein HYU68_11700 [Bacteroidetes bacterium]|nr:hypothetical protein [Bacteroidota bacterium]